MNEEYEVIKPFGLLELWDAFDKDCKEFQLEFRYLLVEYIFSFDWAVRDKNIFFKKERVPSALWRNRHYLEEKGFIKKKEKDILINPGMKLIGESTDDVYFVGEYIICRVGKKTINLFNVADGHPWRFDGYDENLTLNELNDKVKYLQFKFKLKEE